MRLLPVLIMVVWAFGSAQGDDFGPRFSDTVPRAFEDRSTGEPSAADLQKIEPAAGAEEASEPTATEEPNAPQASPEQAPAPEDTEDTEDTQNSSSTYEGEASL